MKTLLAALLILVGSTTAKAITDPLNFPGDWWLIAIWPDLSWDSSGASGNYVYPTEFMPGGHWDLTYDIDPTAGTFHFALHSTWNDGAWNPPDLIWDGPLTTGTHELAHSQVPVLNTADNLIRLADYSATGAFTVNPDGSGNANVVFTIIRTPDTGSTLALAALGCLALASFRRTLVRR